MDSDSESQQDNELYAKSLECRVAVKGAGTDQWTIVGQPGEMARNSEQPLPIELLQQMREGDELWWFCSPELTWKYLCGRAGWAVMRSGQVIETFVTIMS